MQRQAHPSRDHLLHRQPIRGSIQSLQPGRDHAPVFVFIRYQHAARCWRVGRQLRLARLTRGLAAKPRLYHVHKRIAVAVQPHPVLQPVAVSAQPAQHRRQVALAPLRSCRTVDRVMQDHRRKAPIRAQLVAPFLPGLVKQVVAFLLADQVSQFLFSVVAASLNAGHIAAGYQAQVAHAGRVRREQNKEVAAAHQLIREFPQAGIHAVLPVLPKSAQKGQAARVAAGQLHASAGHILAGQFHDAPGQRVVPPGIQAVAHHLAALIAHAVCRQQVPGTRANQQGIIVLAHAQLHRFRFVHRSQFAGQYQAAGAVGFLPAARI